MKKKINITETVLRDAHQSLIATRMTMDEMLPILPVIDKIGYYSVECWGGATFDACLRFLNEDPWERLRILKREMPNSKLQMLFRGQNMLGYRHYADDVLEYFVQKCVANGIDIIRIFDALNDVRNMRTSIKATKREGAHFQACISYTISPVHSTEKFVELAKQLEDEGADSICIKDMAGLLKPYTTHELVSSIKQKVKIPVQIHSHYTSGLASMSHLKAIEAGADGIDTAISPLALGTSHPATESMVAALAGTEYDTGLDLTKLNEVRDYFQTIREKYLKSGQLTPTVMGVDANTLLYQVPGGMLSNLVGQLKEAGKSDKFDEVLKEVPRVREESGYPPLVTPTSQIVGTQAVFNVITGERYKTVTKEFKGMVRGEYGATPVAIAPDFRKKICGDDEPIDCRPADLLKPELAKLKKDVKELAMKNDWRIAEEDVLSYAMFPQVAGKFFDLRRDKEAGVDAEHADRANKVVPVV
ncbi:pyruvate carboxylase [Clostridia bacterium]|nr:pyruvate carboxylase [Clostridia bacterium]GHU57515.1 pyruvate carboxylase [Clostridia bacterium]